MAIQWKIPEDIEKLVFERDKCYVYFGCEFGIERTKKEILGAHYY